MDGQDDVGGVDGGGFQSKVEALVVAGLGRTAHDARPLRLDGARLMEKCQTHVAVRRRRVDGLRTCVRSGQLVFSLTTRRRLLAAQDSRPLPRRPSLLCRRRLVIDIDSRNESGLIRKRGLG